MTTQNAVLEQAKVNWPLVADVVSVPHTQKEYERAIAMLDELIDEVGEAEDHPLASLMETLGSLIEAYEDEHIAEPLGNPLATLRILMEERNLSVSDLPELGNASTVAAILAGQHELTTAECRALAARFHVSPTVFV